MRESRKYLRLGIEGGAGSFYVFSELDTREKPAGSTRKMNQLKGKTRSGLQNVGYHGEF